MLYKVKNRYLLFVTVHSPLGVKLLEALITFIRLLTWVMWFCSIFVVHAHVVLEVGHLCESFITPL